MSDSPPAVSETAAWTDDDAQRLASLKRCLPHMVGDVGGIWPRDVEWLISRAERFGEVANEAASVRGKLCDAQSENERSNSQKVALIQACEKLVAQRNALRSEREREAPFMPDDVRWEIYATVAAQDGQGYVLAAESADETLARKELPKLHDRWEGDRFILVRSTTTRSRVSDNA
jgi:hypothetical protein